MGKPFLWELVYSTEIMSTEPWPWQLNHVPFFLYFLTSLQELPLDLAIFRFITCYILPISLWWVLTHSIIGFLIYCVGLWIIFTQPTPFSAIRLPYGRLHTNVRRTMNQNNLLRPDITTEILDHVVNPFAANALVELINPIVKGINHLEFFFPLHRAERKLKTSQINWMFCQLNALAKTLKKRTGRQIIFGNPSDKLARMIVPIARSRVGHPDDFTMEGMILFLQSVNEGVIDGTNCHRISATGRLILHNFLHGVLLVRGSVIQSLENNPSILDIPISRPIIILGLPRTGSTFLQAMLAQDPDARHLRFWEGNIPNPPPKESTYLIDPRIQLAEKGLNSAKIIDEEYLSGTRMYHFVSGGGIEEELMVMHHCMLFFSHYYLAGEGAFKNWFFDQNNKAFAYRYLRRFLQHLSSKYPARSHWLLKAPVNTLFIDTILSEFDDACVVMTHRHPKHIIPSWAQFQAQMLNIYLEIDQDSSNKWIEESLYMTAEMARRIVAYRKKVESNHRILDISFEALTSDPMGTVEKIYTHFGKNFSPTFREKLKLFLQSEQKEGKSHAPKLNLEDVGLSDQVINEQFAEYLKLYIS